MQLLRNYIVIVSIILWLTACVAEKVKEPVAEIQLASLAEVPDSAMAPPAPVATSMPATAPQSPKLSYSTEAIPYTSGSKPATLVMMQTEAYDDSKQASIFKMASTTNKANARRPASAQSSPPTAATNPNDDPQSIIQRIDVYFNSLNTAAYTFNPPSPISVAKPVTVHLWVDPQATSAALAEELKKLVPRDATNVESGNTKWSPKMRATLSGSDFGVKAIDQEEQPVSSTQRTTWSWDITPLHPGEKLALHLRLAVVLPPELGPPKTVTTIDREINVEVTWWWLFDYYFEKYWKWLLGGLGSVVASAFAWWWKNRSATGKSAK